MKKLLVMFPGQGAQAVGMGKDVVEQVPESQRWFDRASEALGFDLAQVCFAGPEEELTRSDRAQPAIFVLSVLTYELLRERSEVECVAAGGLSSGEWAALYAAGVVSFEDAIRVLKKRGELMQQACEAEEGGMVSIIGLDVENIEAICADVGIEVANYNSPGQTVVSGAAAGCARVPELAKAAGAKLAVPLSVAGAFHSKLMAPAEQAFAEFLQDIELKEPSFPVFSNVTGAAHVDAASIREAMPKQITSPVRWVENYQGMLPLGADLALEFGPGKVLSGLAKRIDKSIQASSVSDFNTLEKALASLGA